MVRAWLMDSSDEDQRFEHQQCPPVPVSIETVKNDTGVLYCKIAPGEEGKAQLAALREERGYSYEDVIEISPEKMANYDEAIKKFYKEHLHTDEEIRYVLAGTGYFDVRGGKGGLEGGDAWVRIAMEEGDLIVLPAGIYHRFTLDQKNYIKATRLFVGEPVWTPHFRPADALDERKAYVRRQEAGFQTLQQL